MTPTELIQEQIDLSAHELENFNSIFSVDYVALTPYAQKSKPLNKEVLEKTGLLDYVIFFHHKDNPSSDFNIFTLDSDKRLVAITPQKVFELFEMLNHNDIDMCCDKLQMVLKQNAMMKIASFLEQKQRNKILKAQQNKQPMTV